MNTWACLLNLVIVCVFANSLAAQELALKLPSPVCGSTQAGDGAGGHVMLFQHMFDDGVHDLAMHLATGEVKRVTFGGYRQAKCYYHKMLLAKGGDWGWHLAWVTDDDKVLNYTRMDGAAWVSSPIKKLSKNVVISNQPAILLFEKNVWIVWSTPNSVMHHIYTVYSDDEGRSWNPAKLLTQTAVEISQPRLVLKESRPYLVWGDASEIVPLLE